MNRGLPSMTALLGVLAIAGYQNRDKLAEMLRGSSGQRAGPQGEAGRAGGIGTGPGADVEPGIGGVLAGGIREIVDRFRAAGQGEAADSWVRTGPNRPVASDQLATALGPDTLATLARQTGLPREEILARLTRDLPEAVDRYTPEGRLPDA
jgi:uncharacterized protein YidB (DUF937 family)